MDFIDLLRESKNKLLNGEADDYLRWKALKHNKEGLELFLAFNIAELQFQTKNGEWQKAICTSNTSFIQLFSAKKQADKKKLVVFSDKGIHTRRMESVKTWDLAKNKYITILLDSWSIMNFVEITPKNIVVLDQIARELLKRGQFCK